MRRTLFLAAAFAAVAWVIPSCGGGGDGGVRPDTLSWIELTPENPGMLITDQQVTFTAVGHYHDYYGGHYTKDVTATAAWTTSDPQCATIIAPGVAACHGVGTTTVTVSIDGASVGTRLVVSVPVLLARTGQTTSYATNDDGAVQSGVGAPSPRFVKHGDGTVSDRLTGLMWVDDANSMLTYYPGAPMNGGHGSINGIQGALDYIAGLNDGTYKVTNAVYTDWRLPNAVELESLINHGAANNAAWLESTAGFVNVDVGFPGHISATGMTHHERYNVDMRTGVVTHWTSIGHIWPVRTEVPPHQAPAGLASGQMSALAGGPEPGTLGWPNPRFEMGTGIRTGTAYDRMTGLTWAKMTSANLTWQEAVDYANSLSVGGYTDWRLPNRKEMRTLADYGESRVWIEAAGLIPSRTLLWTSTTTGWNPDAAWTVLIDFAAGHDDTGTFGKQFAHAGAWPVRGP